MDDTRRFASPEQEDFALESFDLKMPPEEFAARRGHEFATFSFDQVRYRHPGMTAFVDELARIFFSPEMPHNLRKLREQYLTASEIESAEAFERDPF